MNAAREIIRFIQLWLWAGILFGWGIYCGGHPHAHHWWEHVAAVTFGLIWGLGAIYFGRNGS